VFCLSDPPPGPYETSGASLDRRGVEPMIDAATSPEAFCNLFVSNDPIISLFTGSPLVPDKVKSTIAKWLAN
jgi:hypothetical protein